VNALLDTLKEQVDKARAAKAAGGVWNWFAYIFLAAVVSLGVAYALYRLNKKNAELAQLRSQVEKNEVEAANARHFAMVNTEHEDIQRLAQEAAKMTENAKAQRAQLQAAQAETDAHVERALSTRDWASLDATNAAGRGHP